MNSEERKVTPKKAGFTLVELVVVIAILGILAGIGYVGYSGYIRYARRAADDEYIGAVNEALAAACQEAGVDHSKLGPNAAEVSFRDSSNKEGTTKLITIAMPDANVTSNQEKAAKKRASVKNSFDRYFEGEKGNKDMVLKYYDADSIVFVGQGQLFVAYGDAESVKKSIWEQSGFKKAPEHVKDVVKALSNFIGASGLADDINHKSLDYVLSEVRTHLKNIKNTEEINDYFERLGFTVDDLTTQQFETGFTAYIADATSKMSSEGRAELIEEIRSRDVKATTSSYEGKDYANYEQDVENYKDPLLEIPMQLAALEGYYNSGQASDGFKTRFDALREGYKGNTAGLDGLLKMQSGGVSVFLDIKDEGVDSDELERFRAYKNSSQFDTDMNAYFDILEQATANIDDGLADGSLKPDEPSFLDSIFDFLN